MIPLPAGATEVTFRYRVSSEEKYDFFRFFIGSMEMLAVSGDVAWTQAATYDVTGASGISFQYTKDPSQPGGLDAAFVDQITFTVPDSGGSAEVKRVAARYTGTATSLTHTISWTAPTPGTRLIVAVNSHVSISSVSPGWVKDGGDDARAFFSKISTAADTSITITLATADPRLFATVYERDDCQELMPQAVGQTGGFSVTSLSVSGTVLPAAAGRVFGIAKSGTGVGGISWSPSMALDYSTSGTNNYCSFSSGPIPVPGSRIFTASGYTSTTAFFASMAVACYGNQRAAPRAPRPSSIAAMRAATW
ncbi:hypothetical protein ACFQX6_11060 [Streptosporangium lutulentum]